MWEWVFGYAGHFSGVGVSGGCGRVREGPRGHGGALAPGAEPEFGACAGAARARGGAGGEAAEGAEGGTGEVGEGWVGDAAGGAGLVPPD